jgi:hypothetical protein
MEPSRCHKLQDMLKDMGRVAVIIGAADNYNTSCPVPMVAKKVFSVEGGGAGVRNVLISCAFAAVALVSSTL